MLILGLNSNFHIDYEGGDGFINIEKLREELKNIEANYNEYSKIVSFHHNIFSSYENKGTGQWDINNRKDVISILNEFSFKCILYGNEHTRDSKFFGSNKEDLMYRSDCGCFASRKSIPSSFKIYELQHNSKRFSLKNNVVVIQNANKRDEHDFGMWGIQDNKDINEVEEFVLNEVPQESLNDNSVLDNMTKFHDAETEIVGIDATIGLENYTNAFYKDKLFKLIKSKRLFHSGHFHWSETSRAHNWIDVSKILNDQNDLLEAKKAIVDVIEVCKLTDRFDFIIGLGIEGNILSTRASLKYDKPYSFLPYSYRYDEHNNYEKALNFANNNNFKSVLIITDVVNEGRTLRKLINKRETDFFQKVEKIIVVSLFYTGQDASGFTDILNTKKGKYDAKNDHLENRIEYYYVLDLKVEKCPYGDSYSTDCLIVREKLGCVYNFYDYKKAFEKKQNEIKSKE